MASNMMKALRICGRQCFNVIDTFHCHHSTRTISTSANCLGTAKDRRAKKMVNECRERGINIIRDPQINKVIGVCLHQASVSTLQQLWDDGNTVLTENNGVA